MVLFIKVIRHTGQTGVALHRQAVTVNISPKSPSRAIATMDVSPEIKLAANVFAAKSVYAVLLGSGISRAAGIPTDWAILLDLLDQVATIQGTAPANPVEWYRSTFGKEPNYSDILQILSAENPFGRQALLNQYFVPSEEDVRDGRRMPTKAHRALANLVKRGYVKVIVTTNFDTLMEKALIDVGAEPP